MTAPSVARTSWLARGTRLAIVTAASLALSVCGEPPTGLRTEADGLARLAFQPELRPADRPLFQNANVGIDKVYLVIRASDGTIVFERVVDFPAGQDAVEIVADVPVHGESERFSAQFELRNGTTTIFRGTQEVVARPGRNAPTQTTVALNFVGPGATAVSVAVTPSTSTLLAGALTTLTANASDAAGAVIVNALFSWSSSDPTIATVSPTGSVTAGTRRGTATITASTLSGISGNANVAVTLPAARVVVESPASLAGRVGSTLAAPFTVRVVASDDVPVSGTVVNFAALASGAQVGSATATTDAAGRASTTMTLGGALNAQLFTATVTGLAPVTLSVDATVGLPDAIAAVNAPPASETIGRALPQPFTVRVTDRFGNPVPNVSVA
ncbi:MAG: Ig-like domain-containing protein, partial [Gemmatimonadota bacterium]|nr:Ig-like domain-containing protein [Gemmatimonadota bacterium]